MTARLRLEPVNGSLLTEYRLRSDGAVERRVLMADGRRPRDGERGEWVVQSRSALLALPSDGIVWQWLREHGVRRPSPSGPSGSYVPDVDRGTERITLRVDPETASRLRALAAERGVTIAALVTALLDDAEAS